MHAAAVVANFPAVLDGVAGNLIENGRNLRGRFAGGVNLRVVHVGESRAGQQHAAAAGVADGVAVKFVAAAVEVQPQGVTANVFETAVPVCAEVMNYFMLQ